VTFKEQSLKMSDIIQWTVTSGDLLQILAVVGAILLYGARLEGQNRVSEAKRHALEKRLDSNERRTDNELTDIRRTLQDGFRAIQDRLDAKMDKE
jgi:hypothetical protein